MRFLNCCDDVLCASVVVPEKLVVWKLNSLKTSYHLSGSCVSLMIYFSEVLALNFSFGVLTACG